MIRLLFVTTLHVTNSYQRLFTWLNIECLLPFSLYLSTLTSCFNVRSRLVLVPLFGPSGRILYFTFASIVYYYIITFKYINTFLTTKHPRYHKTVQIKLQFDKTKWIITFLNTQISSKSFLSICSF